MAATVAVAFPAVLAVVWPAELAGPGLGLAIVVATFVPTAAAGLWFGGAAWRQVLLVGCAAAAAGIVLERPTEPAAALVCVLGLGALVVYAHGWLAIDPIELTTTLPGRWSSSAVAALVHATSALRIVVGEPLPAVAAAASLVPVLACVEADRRAKTVSAPVARLTWLGAAAVLPVLLTDAGGPGWTYIAALPVAAAAVFRRVDGWSVVGALVATPARLMVVSFATICAWGTALLTVGPSGAEAPLPLIDAAFTAVSATCVTGLTVVDTASRFSWFGEAVILTLIQVGGLGIMTFAAAASVWTGRRLSLREEATTADLLGPEARRDLQGALETALKVTVYTELATAAVLLVAFLRQGDPLITATWRALFTAVSAFCNAGFGLQPDNLVPYQRDPLVLVPVAVALVIGGLGPSVVAGLPHLVRGAGSLHARVALTTTAALIVVPWALYAVLEWNASLGGLSPASKVLNAWFQAITPRTAGFNSVDLTGIRPPTWTLLCVLMFVGGSPGSTAGGIKTTTFAAVVLTAIAAVRGREHAVAFGRRLPPAVVQQALAATAAGVGSVVIALLALQLTQDMPLDLMLFEVVSALGTVGLTLGGTPLLDGVGKVIVMACMFAGRVGPLTVFVVLAERRAREVPRPEGTMLVG